MNKIETSKAAAKLGSISTPAKADAARKNGASGGRPTVKGRYSPTLHRDGTVTYWSVYRQVWERTGSIAAEELASQGSVDRDRIVAHLARG